MNYNLIVMKRLLLVVLASVILGGCAYQQQTTNTTSENGEKWISVECFQTLENTDDYSICLAKDYNWNVYYIIHFTCPTSQKSEVYYDGKSLNGKYVFIGTYSYENKEGSTKTVRAYMSKENYSEWCDYDKDALIHLLDVALTYNSIK